MVGSGILHRAVDANTLQKLLTNLDPDSNRRGRQFEQICRWYLLNDPVYQA